MSAYCVHKCVCVCVCVCECVWHGCYWGRGQVGGHWRVKACSVGHDSPGHETSLSNHFHSQGG